MKSGIRGDIHQIISIFMHSYQTIFIIDYARRGRRYTALENKMLEQWQKMNVEKRRR